MVRRLTWIGSFISLLFVVLFGLVASPKAKGLSPTLNLNNPELVGNFQGGRCILNIGATGIQFANINTSDYCEVPANSPDKLRLKGFTSNIMNNINPDKYYVFTIQVFGRPVNESFGSIWTTPSKYGPWTIVSVTENYDVSSADFCYGYLQNTTLNSICQVGFGNAVPLRIQKYTVVLKVSDSNQVPNYIGFALPGTTSANDWLTVPYNVYIADVAGAVQGFQFSDIYSYDIPENTSQYLEQQKQEDENQGTQSNTDSDQAGQDVEGATTNLLSAITGFFGAFTSASATTCQTDWGIEGFRNFDFCGTQIPSGLRIIFTIVASVIFIPMIWFLINSILNAFKEFQQ